MHFDLGSPEEPRRVTARQGARQSGSPRSPPGSCSLGQLLPSDTQTPRGVVTGPSYFELGTPDTPIPTRTCRRARQQGRRTLPTHGLAQGPSPLGRLSESLSPPALATRGVVGGVPEGGVRTSRRLHGTFALAHDDAEADGRTHTFGIAREAKDVAAQLLEGGHEHEGNQLTLLLPSFQDDSLGYEDLAPYLSYLLGSSRGPIQNQEEGSDDEEAAPTVGVRALKAHVRNSKEAEKNATLLNGNVLLEDVQEMRELSTAKCKCDTHHAVTLDAVQRERAARASMSTGDKRRQVEALCQSVVRLDRHGRRTATGKASLDGVPLCLKMWTRILKVSNR